jgi:subtilisin family serine protease
MLALLVSLLAAGAELRIEARGGLPALVPVVRADGPAAVSPALRALVDSGDRVAFMVDLRDQLDFRRAAAALSRASPSRDAQRSWVTRALGAIARRSLRRMRPQLEKLQEQGAIDSWTPVSIVDRLLVRGSPAAIRALARDPEVASLIEEIESEAALQDDGGDAAGDADSSWPLDALGAKQAWLAGIDGTGVTVGLIDSGASDRHEQLAGNFRGGPRAWFDLLRGGARPSDVQLGHGTAVLACAVGRSAGVAPGAKWIAAVGLNGGRYNNLLVTRAADWMLNAGRPAVLIVPWRLPGDRCDGSLQRIIDAWRAAGIVVVFAAGNSGPVPSSDVSPANSGDLFPGSQPALSIGAIGQAKEIDPHSSRGPGRCGTAVFPQLVAPGAGVRVALPAGSSLYRLASGTSFAAGYAAGAATLLVQRCPGARVEQIEEALRQGARDLGAPGPDPAYGYGLIDVPRSLAAVAKRCRRGPERGRMSGRR